MSSSNPHSILQTFLLLIFTVPMLFVTLQKAGKVLRPSYLILLLLTYTFFYFKTTHLHDSVFDRSGWFVSMHLPSQCRRFQNSYLMRQLYIINKTTRFRRGVYFNK